VHESTHDIVGFHQSEEYKNEVSPSTGWHHEVNDEVQHSNTQQQPKGLPKFFGSVTFSVGDIIDCVVIPRFVIEFHDIKLC